MPRVLIVDPRVIETEIITGAPKNRWSLLVCEWSDDAEISAGMTLV